VNLVTPILKKRNSIDEKFIYNQRMAKFLYCENQEEVKEQFENILEENDWFAKCYETNLWDA
jgi:hypothetical protein